MYKVIHIRCKSGGGADKSGERQQRASLAKQKELDAKLEAIDKEYYEMRQENKAQYDERFRPLEEGLMKRVNVGAKEATSAEGRASEYAAADAASEASLERRNERIGINNSSTEAQPDDDYIRAIALTAVGNASKGAALETQSRLQKASLGVGVGINQDIGREFGRATGTMQQGLGHADAAFSNFSNQQTHLNNAYAAKQQGYSALIKTGTSVVGMGIGNFNTANEGSILSSNGPISGWGDTTKAAFGGGY
jgi:hypothetical protein